MKGFYEGALKLGRRYIDVHAEDLLRAEVHACHPFLQCCLLVFNAVESVKLIIIQTQVCLDIFEKKMVNVEQPK